MSLTRPAVRQIINDDVYLARKIKLLALARKGSEHIARAEHETTPSNDRRKKTHEARGRMARGRGLTRSCHQRHKNSAIGCRESRETIGEFVNSATNKSTRSTTNQSNHSNIDTQTDPAPLRTKYLVDEFGYGDVSESVEPASSTPRGSSTLRAIPRTRSDSKSLRIPSRRQRKLDGSGVIQESNHVLSRN